MVHLLYVLVLARSGLETDLLRENFWHFFSSSLSIFFPFSTNFPITRQKGKEKKGKGSTSGSKVLIQNVFRRIDCGLKSKTYLHCCVVFSSETVFFGNIWKEKQLLQCHNEFCLFTSCSVKQKQAVVSCRVNAFLKKVSPSIMIMIIIMTMIITIIINDNNENNE